MKSLLLQSLLVKMRKGYQAVVGGIFSNEE
jgi:hypothetical protein